MKILIKQYSIVSALIMALFFMMPLSHAQSIETQDPASLDIKIQLQEIMNLLQPINVKKVDGLSKDLFKDFFEQKDKLYGYAIVNPENQGEVPPVKLHRRTF